MKLILGVIDLLYGNAKAETKRDRDRRLKKEHKADERDRDPEDITTGDVAEFLEDQYAPMQTFWDHHGKECADKMTEGLVGTMENVLMGAPLSNDPFGEAEAFIESKFKDFITTGEMEKLGVPGVPTQAAIDRRSLRFKKKKELKGKRRKPVGPRPSFVDTGLYVASFKPEIEE